jgi:hypothetical protein
VSHYFRSGRILKDKTLTTDPAMIDALRNESLRIEEDSEHSAKRHFNTWDMWSVLHYALGVPATILAAAASTALVKNEHGWAQLMGLAVALFAALMTFLKPNDRAAQHRAVGNQYLSLRNDARMFREIDLIEAVDDTKKSERLRRLAQRRNDLNSSAPSTPRWAFERTRQGIADGETTYRVDKD